MELKRKDLLAALQKALPGVETGNALLDGADTFCFSGGNIYSYNDNISVTVPFPLPEPIEGAVKAKEFYSIISKLPGDDLKVVAVEGNWIIKAGSAKIELTLLEASALARVKGILTDSIQWAPVPARFQDGIKIARFSSNRSTLSGIIVSGNRMLATDEMRINSYVLDSEMETFWVSDAAATELMDLKDLKDFGLTTAWAHFRTADGATFSCKRLQHAKFPMAKLLELADSNAQTDGDIVNVIPPKLVEAVDRAAALAMDIESFDAVRLTISPEGIEVYTQRSTGKYTEKVAWEAAPANTFPATVVLIDSAMMGYGLKRSRTVHIKQSPNKQGKITTRLVFEGEHIRHIASTLSAE